MRVAMAMEMERGLRVTERGNMTGTDASVLSGYGKWNSSVLSSDLLHPARTKDICGRF